MQLMLKVAAAVAVAFTAATAAHSGVSPAEAAKLKSELTPLGAERAANKDGTIPAWTGGLTTPTPGYKGGRRPDPFASEKPILQITAKNMDQHASRLTDGVKALLKKYPDTYRSATATEIDAMGKRLIPDQNHVWVIVGDRAKIEKGVRELNLGEVRIVDANGDPID